MGVLGLDAIKSGMILAGDVRDRTGRVLLSAGSEVTEKHLRIFKMWGILSVQIQGEEREESPLREDAEIDPARLKEAESRVSELFHHNDLHHPFIKELFRLVTLEHLSAREDPHRGA